MNYSLKTFSSGMSLWDDVEIAFYKVTKYVDKSTDVLKICLLFSFNKYTKGVQRMYWKTLRLVISQYIYQQMFKFWDCSTRKHLINDSMVHHPVYFASYSYLEKTFPCDYEKSITQGNFFIRSQKLNIWKECFKKKETNITNDEKSVVLKY